MKDTQEMDNEMKQTQLVEFDALNVGEAKEKEEIMKTDLEEQRRLQEDFMRVPSWNKQITVRGIVASLVIGILYSIIIMKLNLTTGLVPPLNVSAALLVFVFLRSWTTVLKKAGLITTPFTRQENIVVQTCAVACYSIALGGGFGSYLLALGKKTYELAGVDTDGNAPGSYKNPEIGWMTCFLFAVSFVGLLSLVPLRKIMIIDYKLTYPTGTATAHLVNGFHTPQGDKDAKRSVAMEYPEGDYPSIGYYRKQVRSFTRFFSFSFLWGFFQWFYSGGEQCGFSKFPTFGLQAWKQTFYFDFSLTYVGAGMIISHMTKSHITNLSLLLGAVISWGVMWPLIEEQKGNWFRGNLPESSMRSLQGYKVFIAIALIFGDGLYNFTKVLSFTIRSFRARLKQVLERAVTDGQNPAPSEHYRNETFMRERIPVWVACTGYTFFSIVSIIAIPRMFPEVTWYYVVIAYVFAPAFGFCNAYGAGLTDMNMAHNYGKVSLFVLAAWAGRDNGVIAGLVGCGLIKSIASISADLMQDLKAGHLTLTSPRSMLLSQAIGTAMGCVVAPLSFFLFYKAFDVGNPNGDFKAPYALIYRNMAILGVEGFSALPQHCLQLCCGFFALAVAANLVRDLSPPKFSRWVPLPMAMAVPFLVGAYFAIDMCLGSLVVFIWSKLNGKKASLMVPAVASGLICGDGLWVLPSSILALANIKPPICMKFLSS